MIRLNEEQRVQLVAACQVPDRFIGMAIALSGRSNRATCSEIAHAIVAELKALEFIPNELAEVTVEFDGVTFELTVSPHPTLVALARGDSVLSEEERATELAALALASKVIDAAVVDTFRKLDAIERGESLWQAARALAGDKEIEALIVDGLPLLEGEPLGEARNVQIRLRGRVEYVKTTIGFVTEGQ